MGCDIHTHIEVLSDGEWFFVGDCRSDRNYRFFSLLSGVRSYDEVVEPFFPTLDDSIAKEMSKVVQQEYDKWGIDAHSLTICSLEALKQMHDKLQSRHNDMDIEYGIHEYLQDWITACSAWLSMFDDVRVVVWYDN